LIRNLFLVCNHIKKSFWSKTGFAVFPDAFENYWKFFTFDPLKYQLDSLSYQKQSPLFKIEALLLLQNVVTDKKKKHTSLAVIRTKTCISIPLNGSLRRISLYLTERNGTQIFHMKYNRSGKQLKL
ncbi:Sec23 trunk domain-containing protein, partial [Aphis craccivora]